MFLQGGMKSAHPAARFSLNISTTDGRTPTLSHRVSMQKTQMKPVDDRLKQEGMKLRDRESEAVTAEAYEPKRRTDETKTKAISL